MESIISAIIAGAVTLIGVLIANGKSQAQLDTMMSTAFTPTTTARSA